MHRLKQTSVRALIIVIAAGLLFQLPACYYIQAARGHMDVMNQRRPVAEVIADQESPQDLKERLGLVQLARDYAVQELKLPDNESYRSYSDIGRDYVVWNVFAAPEFSLQAKSWCFPVAGCVAYRGYFSEEAAKDFAAKLSAQGYDVSVGGVSAYSTLGKFADPVLNTMMRWSDVELVSTIFHELAHQRLYIKNDTAFNESFATAVATTGIERWLQARNETNQHRASTDRKRVRSDVMKLVKAARAELQDLYASEVDVSQKRSGKREILDRLSEHAGDVIEKSNSGMRNWLAAPLNNARLVSLGLYEGGQNAFSRILDDCDADLTCFYATADSLAKLSPDERKEKLEEISD
jgi:predicted aminopeptidase